MTIIKIAGDPYVELKTSLGVVIELAPDGVTGTVMMETALSELPFFKRMDCTRSTYYLYASWLGTPGRTA